MKDRTSLLKKPHNKIFVLFLTVLLLISFFNFNIFEAASKRPDRKSSLQNELKLPITPEAADKLTVTVQYIMNDILTEIKDFADIKDKTIIAKAEPENFRLTIQAPEGQSLSGEVIINDNEAIALENNIFEYNLNKNDTVTVNDLLISETEAINFKIINDYSNPVIKSAIYNNNRSIVLAEFKSNIFKNFRTITVKAEDNAKLEKLYYKFGEDELKSVSLTDGVYIIPELTSYFKGKLTIYVQDYVGNISESKIYNLIIGEADTTIPVINSVFYNNSDSTALTEGISNKNIFNEYKSITVKASDNVSLEKLYYKFNSEEVKSAEITDGKYVIPAFTDDFNGTLTLYVKDTSGIKSQEKIYNLIIDKTSPVIRDAIYNNSNFEESELL
jgi:hypothetical protein